MSSRFGVWIIKSLVNWCSDNRGSTVVITVLCILLLVKLIKEDYHLFYKHTLVVTDVESPGEAYMIIGSHSRSTL